MRRSILHGPLQGGQAYTSAVASLPAGFRTLFAPPTLGAQFRYARGSHASASAAIQQVPEGTHDRLVATYDARLTYI